MSTGLIPKRVKCVYLRHMSSQLPLTVCHWVAGVLSGCLPLPPDNGSVDTVLHRMQLVLASQNSDCTPTSTNVSTAYFLYVHSPPPVGLWGSIFHSVQFFECAKHGDNWCFLIPFWKGLHFSLKVQCVNFWRIY